MGEVVILTLPLEIFTKKLCSRLYSSKIITYLQNKNKKSLLGHPVEDLGVTYALHL